MVYFSHRFFIPVPIEHRFPRSVILQVSDKVSLPLKLEALVGFDLDQ
ncbi:MAG: hypothetical protein Q8O29_10615 [Polaromonas sp.]|nr:hypothetical protein [Polaromonas sp.]MDP2818705.1 hypothetical protein [Polaromonas sp.]